MELDEMKRLWAHMELRQDGMEALLRQDYRDRRRDKARAAMRRAMGWQALELVLWLAFVVWVASFWVDHRHVTHLLVIGLVLHVYGLAGIWSCATQLLFLGRIYLFDAPVLVLQRRLAQLRRFRVMSSLALGLPWWCLWLLVSTVGLVWLGGADIYAAGSPTWYWASLGVGVLGMVVCVWLARRLADRPLRSPLLRRMVEDMSGCSLRRVAEQFDAIARFERE